MHKFLFLASFSVFLTINSKPITRSEAQARIKKQEDILTKALQSIHQHIKEINFTQQELEVLKKLITWLINHPPLEVPHESDIEPAKLAEFLQTTRTLYVEKLTSSIKIRCTNKVAELLGTIIDHALLFEACGMRHPYGKWKNIKPGDKQTFFTALLASLNSSR